MKVMSKINIFVKTIIITIFVFMLVGATSENNNSKVKNNYLNLSLDINKMSSKRDRKYEEYLAFINDNYSAKEQYTGDLTGYGADCPLCSGRLACMPSLDVLHGNYHFDDSTYGNVRIVASSSNLPCGSVIRFDFARQSDDPIIAIVLDRGVLGTDIDLLEENSQNARLYVGRSVITYDVLRRGW